jgi:hypothetical protein
MPEVADVQTELREDVLSLYSNRFEAPLTNVQVFFPVFESTQIAEAACGEKVMRMPEACRSPTDRRLCLKLGEYHPLRVCPGPRAGHGMLAVWCTRM